MADNPSKLQNIQLTTEPSDGFATAVVKPDSLTGGAIDGCAVAGSAEKGVERRPCDCKYVGLGLSESGEIEFIYACQGLKNRTCVERQRNLP